MSTRTISGWGYGYRLSTGELVSEGTVITDPLPAGYGLYEWTRRHDPEAERWDPASRTVVAYTNTARIAELAAQRDALDARIVELTP